MSAYKYKFNFLIHAYHRAWENNLWAIKEDFLS